MMKLFYSLYNEIADSIIPAASEWCSRFSNLALADDLCRGVAPGRSMPMTKTPSTSLKRILAQALDNIPHGAAMLLTDDGLVVSEEVRSMTSDSLAVPANLLMHAGQRALPEMPGTEGRVVRSIVETDNYFLMTGVAASDLNFALVVPNSINLGMLRLASERLVNNLRNAFGFE